MLLLLAIAPALEAPRHHRARKNLAAAGRGCGAASPLATPQRRSAANVAFALVQSFMVELSNTTTSTTKSNGNQSLLASEDMVTTATATK